MEHTEIEIIESVLSEEIGSTWPSFLTECLNRQRGVLNNTHWAREKSEEAEFAERLSIAPAIYLNLVDKLGKERAFEMMRKILVPISVNEQEGHLNSLDISNKKGMDRLAAFWDFTVKDGVGKFNQEAIIKQNSNVLHYEVTSCFFARFYEETGTPELTKLFCDSDKEFYTKFFPDFEFHRGSSWENTIGYGKDRCTFIFEKKD